MTVVARDIFSGDADPDIDGRTPDGGLDAALAGVGLWAKSADPIAIVPGVGAQHTTLATTGGAFYDLTGLTLSDSQWLVRATIDWHGSTVAAAGLYGNDSIGAVSGQQVAFELFVDHSLGWAAYLGIYTDEVGGTFFALTEASLPDFDPSVPHTIVLTRSGDVVSGSIDGVGVVSYDVTLNPDPGTYNFDLTGGDPAIFLANRELVSAKIACTLFEVESEGSLPLSPCVQSYESALYARDYFTGADVVSIEGRVPDGGSATCLQQGHWHNVAMRFNVAPGQHVEIQSEELVQINAGAQPWSHESVEDIPSLGNDYTVELEGYFNEHFDTGSRYAWISCLVRQQMGGVDTTTFTSNNTWVCPSEVYQVTVRCWQGGCTGGGATGTISAGGGGAGGAYAEKTIATVPGTTYTVTVGAARAGTNGTGQPGNPTIFLNGATTLVRASSTGGGGGLASTASSNGTGGVADTTGSVGDTIIAGQNGAAGNFTAGVAGGQGGAGANGGGPQSAAPGDNTAGVAGNAPGGGSSGGKTQTATDRASGQGARGQVQIEFGRGGHAQESGYELLFDNAGSFHFIYFINGTYFHRVELENPLPVVPGQRYRVRMCAMGSTFCCSLDDQQLITTTATEWAEGPPGFCMMDGMTAIGGRLAKVTGWRVSSDVANAPLCGGDGSGHGSPGGSEEATGFIWGFNRGAHRPAPVPDATNLIQVQGHRQGAKRQIKRAWGWRNGAWREAIAAVGGGDPSDGGIWNGDPGDALPDPGCGQVPVPDIPSEPLLPLEDRLFFCYNLPLEGATDPFDTAVWATGEWTPSYLAICAAKGMRLIGGVGGYSKYFTDGEYDEAKMFAKIASHASYFDTVQTYSESGIFYGQLVIDDYHSADRWGRIITLDEVDDIAARWKFHYPWIRTVLRDTPTNVAGYGSNTMSNIDTFLAQYVVRYGDVETWMNNQIDAASGHFGGKAILWSLNFKHPRGMTSAPMTAADLLEFGTPLAQQSYSHGLGGWEYDLRFLNQPGAVNALSQLRNIMAGVPA